MTDQCVLWSPLINVLVYVYLYVATRIKRELEGQHVCSVLILNKVLVRAAIDTTERIC